MKFLTLVVMMTIILEAVTNTPQELYVWAKKSGAIGIFSDEFVRLGVFGEREISRMVG